MGQQAGRTVRVCIISEGAYPIVRGGLSEWAHLLIKTLTDIEFDVLCIARTGKEKGVYDKLPNLNRVMIRPLLTSGPPRRSSLPGTASARWADLLRGVLQGAALDCEGIVKFGNRYPLEKEWLTSRGYWDWIVRFYERSCPETPFVEYFWTSFGIYSVLIDIMHLIDQIPGADVYHSLTSGIGGFVGSLARCWYRRPLVVTEQGLYLVEKHAEMSRHDVPEWERQQWMRLYESLVKTSYEYADRIVPPSRSHLGVARSLGADLEKIQVICNGVECDRFKPGPARNGAKLVVGCFARVVPIKDIATLIRAARLVLERHEASFVVVGEVQDHDYYDQCQSLVDELGLKEDFRFVGHANSLEWYHRVDVFVLSSVSEGVPYALLEAMSCGLPCVCTAVGGIPEILSDPGAGCIVAPVDPRGLAQRIGELLENEALRQELGNRARALANQRYHIEDMADGFRRIYQETMSEWEPRGLV